MKFIVLLLFVVLVCGENSRYGCDLPKEELSLDAFCGSFCKYASNATYDDDNCNCGGDMDFNTTEFRNSSLELHLLCKEVDSISVFWETEADFAYALEVLMEEKRAFYNVTLCDSYTIGDLAEDTVYKMRLWSVSYPEREISYSDFLEVRSSSVDSFPSPVEHISVENLTLVEDETEGSYNAVLTWEVNENYSCQYRLTLNQAMETKAIHISLLKSEYEEEQAEMDQQILNTYHWHLENLEFGTEYAVSIRAVTAEHESERKFFNISIPSCLNTYSGNMNKCVPESPQGLVVKEKFIDMVGEDWLYDVNLTWSKPEWPPTSYNACMANILGPSLIDQIKCISINGSEVSAAFERMKLLDEYHVVVWACSTMSCSAAADAQCRVNITDSILVSHGWRSTLDLTLITMLVTIIIMIIGIILIRRYHANQERIKNRCKYLMELEEKAAEATNNLDTDLVIKHDLLLDQWELDSSKLHFESVLGEGAFGIVHRALLEMKDGSKLEVAIKRLKDSPSSEEVRQFIQEIEIMKSVKQHPYVVSLIGCITAGRPEGPLLVVEYCSRGDLQTYLRAAWDKFSNVQRDVIYMDNDPNTSPNYFANRTYDFHNINHGDEFIIQPKHLLSIARQVALGMEHLAKTRVVHRDLAARNVLVCDNHTVKVSDFGLSRDVYQDNVYCKSGGGKLPIRWMALESLSHQIYTTQSDVWSFGILLWEIVTLGGTPYAGIHSCDLLDVLKHGYRLKCPSTCSSDLYTIMQNCWKACPKERPTFTELCKSLEVLLENVSEYLYVENEQSNKFDSLKSPKVSNNTGSYERYIKPISKIK